MRLERIPLTLAGLTLFFSGFATGQQTESRFAGYYYAQRIDKMEWRLLQANLNIMRQRIGFDEKGIGVPDVTFDHTRDTCSAFALVDADLLEKLPMDQLKNRLTGAALTTLLETKPFFKTETGDDLITANNFEMEFRGMAVQRMLEEPNLGLGKEHYEFYAEYKNGELSVRAKTPGLK